MLSWDCVPQPPEIIGPWYLWKLLIDERHQGHGYGREVVRQVADLIRAAGGNELSTSHVVGGDGGPGRFYGDSASCPPENLTHKARSFSASSCDHGDPLCNSASRVVNDGSPGAAESPATTGRAESTPSTANLRPQLS